MKHKTLFRLLLKIIGIGLLGYGVPSLVNTMALICLSLFTSGMMIWPGGVSSIEELLTVLGYQGALGNLLITIAGLYLLFGGRWLTNLCIPSNRPYCPECGYELRGSRTDVCPECGSALPTDLIESLEHTDASIEKAQPEPPPQKGKRLFFPANNPRAVKAYYVAIASLIPVLGIVLGPAAVVFGIEGLRDVLEDPSRGGRSHAWVGIILGIMTTMLNFSGWCLLGAAMTGFDGNF